MPTQRSRELAAQAWCTPANSHKIMDGDLAEAFAEILDNETRTLNDRIAKLDRLTGNIIRGEPFVCNMVTNQNMITK